MPKIDLLRLLNQRLAANSNTPIKPREAPPPQRDARVASAPVRTHRALRPRRRT